MNKAIKRIEAAEKELELAKKDLAENEVTYSIGDRFKIEWAYDNEKYILAFCGNKIDDGPKVSLICLADGCQWMYGAIVEDDADISQNEFEAISDGDKFSRYWDVRKGKLT